MTDSNRMSGVLAPVITPFDAQLKPDHDRFLAHCRWLVSQNAGLAVFGTNSEANSLSVNEKLALLDTLFDSDIDAAMLMPGTGSCALPEAVRLTRAAVEGGCGGVLMLPPFYYKGVSDDGLFAFYAELIEQIADQRLQIYLYHIPPMTQVPLSLALIDRLVNAYPANIAGIKDSSGDWDNTLALNEAGWPDFRVFCGSESFLLRNMNNGGAGCISATANVNPGPIHELFTNYDSGQAEEQQQRLDEIRAIFQSRPMIAALKAANGLARHDPDWFRVRPPLTALPEHMVEDLRKSLEAAGFSMPGIGD